MNLFIIINKSNKWQHTIILMTISMIVNLIEIRDWNINHNYSYKSHSKDSEWLTTVRKIKYRRYDVLEQQLAMW